MCRVVGYVGTSQEDLQNLYQAFIDGSACDPCLRKAGIEFDSHKDGWGYALLAENGLFHYRSQSAVYDDKPALPPLKGRIYAVLHSRLGSDQSLNGHVCAHPFSGSNDEAFFFFAHNGGVDVERPVPRMVDSEWAFEQVLKEGSLEKALPKLKERTKPNAALNLLVLTIPRDPAKATTLQYLNFFKAQNEGREAYYQMFTGDMPSGKAVFSGTIADLKPKGATNIKKAPFDKLLTL